MRMADGGAIANPRESLLLKAAGGHSIPGGYQFPLSKKRLDVT